jgi:hypothetical protein
MHRPVKIIPTVIDVDEISIHNYPTRKLGYFSQNKVVSCFSQLPQQIDLSPMKNIEKGYFEMPKCINYHTLANLKCLQISNCETITDVSCFRNIPNLALDHCSGIIDVSSLRNVHTLNLSGCDGVLDLSSLEWVYSLTFHEFQGTDLSGLKNVAFLDISRSRNVADVTMLRTLISLKIRLCSKIESLSGLSKLKALFVSRRMSSGNEVFSHLSNLSLHYTYFQNPSTTPQENLQFLASLQNLQELEICACFFRVELPLMASLRSLNLKSCLDQGVMPIMPDMPLLSRLTFLFCDMTSLHIKGAHQLRELKVSNCRNLNLIDRKVFKCEVTKCDQLKGIKFQQRVAHLNCFSTFQRFSISLGLSAYVFLSNLKFVVNQDRDELIASHCYSGHKKEEINFGFDEM